jgi:flagellar motor switch protein FliN/FliY
MADASLSQDEIDALLQGADGFDLGGSTATPVAAKTETKKSALSGKELASAAKVVEAIAGAHASGLTASTNKITTIEVSSSKVRGFKEVSSEFDEESLVLKTAYSSPTGATIFTVFKASDAKALAGLMSGSDVEELDESAQSSLQDAFSQMTSSADSQVEGDFGIHMVNSGAKLSVATGGAFNIPDGDYFVVEMSLHVEDTVDSTFFQLYPMSFARALGSGKKSESNNATSSIDNLLDGAMGNDNPNQNVQNAEFSPLIQTADPAITGNIALLLDVPMEVTVELGRATKNVQEVLSLGEGSIIELDKLAGEPVDLLVNGKIIAKGEVVVIDENFGVRVTEIVNLKGRNSQEEG